MTKNKSAKRGRPEGAVAHEVRAKILGVAREHFATHGLQGANLSSIATDAGVANSLINYYFENKSGLFAACMEEFVTHRRGMIEKILSEPRSVDELRVRIQLFIDDMMDSCLKDSGFHDIIFNELRSGNKLVEAVFRETLMVIFNHVVKFFALAQKNGVVKKKLDPEILAQVLFNFITESCRKDYLSEKFFDRSLKKAKYRNFFVQNVMTVFIEGAKA